MKATEAATLMGIVQDLSYDVTDMEASRIIDALYEEFAKMPHRHNCGGDSLEEPKAQGELLEKGPVWVVGFSTEGKDCLSVWDSKEGAIRQKKCLIGKDIYVEKLTLFSRES